MSNVKNFREQLRQRNREIVQREPVTLPESGLQVVVKGLMAGEVNRVSTHKRQGDAQIALATELPSGELIWDAEVKEDLDEIAGLHTVDQATLIQVINRLSGMEKLGKLLSQKDVSGSSSSPTNSGEPSGS